MGKGRNQRILPYLLAANTVNYGKPYKMNTAEATAACLYIVGLKDDARKLLSPFSYGEEFLRLNHEFLEGYSACSNEIEVRQVMAQFESARGAQQQRKEDRLAQQQAAATASGNVGGYMDDMDLPPRDDGEYDDYGYEDEDEEEVELDAMGNTIVKG
jgi:pre-rRNA-processing protein TSR3